MSRSGTGYRVDDQRVDSMQLDGEAVVLNLLSHGYFGLNTTGTAVWDLVKAHPGIPAADVAAALRGNSADAASSLATDVTAFLEQMVGHDLLVECPVAETPAASAVLGDRPYVAPRLDAYGNLDTLILSGE